MSTLCDFTSAEMQPIYNFLLKRQTDGLTHTHYLNGSVAKLGDRCYFCYRTEQQPFFRKPRIHLCQINEGFAPISEHFTLETHGNTRGWRFDFRQYPDYMRAEDPRLFVHGGYLWVMWCDGFKMGYAQIHLNHDGEILTDAYIDDIFFPKPPNVQLGNNYDLREKNWSPFEHKEELWVLYASDPFIFCKLKGDAIVETVTYSNPFNWRWGFIKGGTPLIPVGDRYVTFFHSTKLYQGQGDNKINMNMYMMGALTFDRETLRPLQISRYPLAIPIPDSDPGRINEGSYILFPAGVIRVRNGYWVSLGYNDHTNKVLFVSDSVLEYNLTYMYNENSSELCDNSTEN